MGRRIISRIQHGNGVVLDGENMNRYRRVKNRPLVFVSGMFADGALDTVGMISWSCPKRGGAATPVDKQTIAASRVSHGDGQVIVAYIKSTANPTASLRFTGAQLNRSPRTAIENIGVPKGVAVEVVPNNLAFGVMLR